MNPIETFCTQYFTLEQISPQRQGDVRRALTRFQDFIGKPIVEADDADLTAWMTDRISDDIAPNTVRLYLGAVKPFFAWATRRGLLSPETGALIAEVPPPRGAEDSKPRPYKRTELAQFWVDLDERWPLCSNAQHLARVRRGTAQYKKRAWDHGMRLQIEAIVSLALFMALRRNEIFTLTLDDMHADNLYVLVRGKRHDHREKLREVPYNDAAREAVTAWFRWRRQMKPTHSVPWLQLGPPYDRRAEPMSQRSFAGILAKIGPGYELHRFRHTCATERLRAGMPIEKLQAFLGHANISQTLAYAAIDRFDLGKAVDRSDVNFMRAVGRRAA